MKFQLTGIDMKDVITPLKRPLKSITLDFIWVAFCIVILSACSSNVPEKIKQVPPSNITPDEARQQTNLLSGQMVRWGGEIIRTENKPDFTTIIILAKPLSKNGRPDNSKTYYGRFIAQIKRFVEPSLYTAGREITIVGEFTKITDKMIGEYPYRYPVVTTDSVYLWPLTIEADPGYWNSPWQPWHLQPHYLQPH